VALAAGHASRGYVLYLYFLSLGGLSGELRTSLWPGVLFVHAFPPEFPSGDQVPHQSCLTSHKAINQLPAAGARRALRGCWGPCGSPPLGGRWSVVRLQLGYGLGGTGGANGFETPETLSSGALSRPSIRSRIAASPRVDGVVRRQTPGAADPETHLTPGDWSITCLSDKASDIHPTTRVTYVVETAALTDVIHPSLPP